VSFKNLTPTLNDHEIQELIKKYPKKVTNDENLILSEKTELQKQTALL
jgi:hypothetical protein